MNVGRQRRALRGEATCYVQGAPGSSGSGRGGGNRWEVSCGDRWRRTSTVLGHVVDFLRYGLWSLGGIKSEGPSTLNPKCPFLPKREDSSLCLLKTQGPGAQAPGISTLGLSPCGDVDLPRGSASAAPRIPLLRKLPFGTNPAFFWLFFSQLGCHLLNESGVQVVLYPFINQT